MKNSEYRIQNLAKVEMIQAGPRPLIMFLKDWVIRLTVVEDGHYLCNVKANIFPNQTFPKLQAEMWNLIWHLQHIWRPFPAQDPGVLPLWCTSLSSCSQRERTTPFTLNQGHFKGYLKKNFLPSQFSLRVAFHWMTYLYSSQSTKNSFSTLQFHFSTVWGCWSLI